MFNIDPLNGKELSFGWKREQDAMICIYASIPLADCQHAY
jgi:hypothetical protein